MQKNIHSFSVSKFVFQNLDTPHPGSAGSGRDYAGEFRKIIEENREDIPLADVVLGGHSLTDAAARRYEKLEQANADLPTKDAAVTEGRDFQKDNVPELQFALKDVPQDTPENFSKTLVENIQSAQKGMVEYINAYREKVLGRSGGMRGYLSSKIDEFIADINRDANAMIDTAKQGGSKPIKEQKKNLAETGDGFLMTLAANKGTMQSFVPFKLDAAYKEIDQKIMGCIGLQLLGPFSSNTPIDAIDPNDFAGE